MTTMQETDLKTSKPNPAYFVSGQPKTSRLIGVKIAIFFAFVLSAASLAASGYLYQMLNAERRDRVVLDAAKIQLEDQVSALQQENTQFKDSAEKMQEQLKAYTDERDQWKNQLNEAQAQNSELQAQVNQLEERNKELQASQNFGAAGSLAPAAAASLAAQPAGAAPEAASQASAGQQNPTAPGFQIMTVNRKFNFVVVNVGLQDQIKMGDKLGVMRNQKNVATIQVEKVYDRFSAAAIVEESKDTPIKEGDAVRKI
ncbi:MAG TPA: hypothetical protein VD913_04510 [bacterium]|nr:hypothetical protein [bacterium]